MLGCVCNVLFWALCLGLASLVGVTSEAFCTFCLFNGVSKIFDILSSAACNSCNKYWAMVWTESAKLWLYFCGVRKMPRKGRSVRALRLLNRRIPIDKPVWKLMVCGKTTSAMDEPVPAVNFSSTATMNSGETLFCHAWRNGFCIWFGSWTAIAAFAFFFPSSFDDSSSLDSSSLAPSLACWLVTIAFNASIASSPFSPFFFFAGGSTTAVLGKWKGAGAGNPWNPSFHNEGINNIQKSSIYKDI